jgi:MoaA/NifB/PqqE/SkfB family radical SAM enzyme
MSRLERAIDMARLLRRGGPAICNIAVTNVCNATCDFCNFAYDKGLVTHRTYIDVEDYRKALDILYRRGIRYLTFQGGEPLLHPHIVDMVAAATAKGMGPALVTNAWLLPKKLDALAEAGLKTIFISIDSASAAEHEANRGLKGVCARIGEANRRMIERGMTPLASVAMNKLIGDYRALVPFLQELGFAAVSFSYPRKAALGSSSLVYSEDSSLVDFTPDELVAAFQAVDALRGEFTVHNPQASLADMQRHVRGEREAFPCFGGYKHFYMDWKLDLYRCEAWDKPMCSIWDFERTPLIRDGCTACMTDCYRDSSVMLHFAVSLGDALDHLGRGRVDKAADALFTRQNFRSAKAVLDHSRILARLGALG